MTSSRIVAIAAGLTTVALVAGGCGFGGTETVTVTVPTTPTTATTTTPTTPTTTTPTATTPTTRTGTTATSTTTPATNPVITVNEELQHDLTDLGFYTGPINGEYGPMTTAAVKKFQRAASLPVDGVAGPQTHAAINLALGGDSTDAVEFLQTALTDLCYYRGKVDGVVGSGTEAALLAFQKDEGLTADGRYGPGTADALAVAWPDRPSSCSGKNPSGGGGGTGDTVTIAGPTFSRTFDLSSCRVVGRGVEATGAANGGYRVGLDSPKGIGGTLAVASKALNLDGTVRTITISVNGQFHASGIWKVGGAWTAVGTCND